MNLPESRQLPERVSGRLPGAFLIWQVGFQTGANSKLVQLYHRVDHDRSGQIDFDEFCELAEEMPDIAKIADVEEGWVGAGGGEGEGGRLEAVKRGVMAREVAKEAARQQREAAREAARARKKAKTKPTRKLEAAEEEAAEEEAAAARRVGGGEATAPERDSQEEWYVPRTFRELRPTSANFGDVRLGPRRGWTHL